MAAQNFKDYAPTLSSAGVTKRDCDKVQLPVKQSNSVTQELSKSNVLGVLKDLPRLEDIGYLRIARKNGLSISQVKLIHKEFLLSKNPPEKIVVLEEPIEEL